MKNIYRDKDAFQRIINKAFASAEVTDVKLIAQGRINYVFRVYLNNVSVKTAVIRIRYMEDKKFLQGFFCENWLSRYLRDDLVMMPEVYYADDNNEFGFAFMVCEDIIGPVFSADTEDRYIDQAGEILAGLHLIKTDFIGKYPAGIDQEADAFYDSFFSEVLSRMRLVNPVVYEKVGAIVQQFYNRNAYSDQQTVILHHDYHMRNLIMRESDKKVFVIDWDSARSGVSEIDFIKSRYLFTDILQEKKRRSFYQGYSSVKSLDITENYPIQELIWICKMYLFELEQSYSRDKSFYPSAVFYYQKLSKITSDYQEFADKCYDSFRCN